MVATFTLIELLLEQKQLKRQEESRTYYSDTNNNEKFVLQGKGKSRIKIRSLVFGTREFF